MPCLCLEQRPLKTKKKERKSLPPESLCSMSTAATWSCCLGRTQKSLCLYMYTHTFSQSSFQWIYEIREIWTRKTTTTTAKLSFFFFFWFNLWPIFWLLIFNDNFLIYICHVFILWWWDAICFYHCRNASLPSSPAPWLRNLEEGVKLWTWRILWADLFVLQTRAPKLTAASLAERATQRNYKQNFLSFFSLL